MKKVNILDAPIEIRGLAVTEPGKFYRLPESIIDKVNDGVTGLAKHTAGGRVRFRTDSPEITVCHTVRSGTVMCHMPFTGSNGVDVYTGRGASAVFRGCCKKEQGEGDDAKTFRRAYATGAKPGTLVEVTIGLPLYDGISDLWIGFADDAEIAAPLPHTIDKPIVFYGSSITQGGCASRPANSYCSIIARELDADQINLGFSGSGRGEQIMADYIASLDMSCFVLDYDHNAPTEEHLAATHKNFFDTVRRANPDLPIVIVTRPDFYPNPAASDRRRAIIRATYDAAIEAGDKRVMFVDGENMYRPILPMFDLAAVDGCHPNDLGMYLMALTIGAAVKALLK